MLVAAPCRRFPRCPTFQNHASCWDHAVEGDPDPGESRDPQTQSESSQQGRSPNTKHQTEKRDFNFCPFCPSFVMIWYDLLWFLRNTRYILNFARWIAKPSTTKTGRKRKKQRKTDPRKSSKQKQKGRRNDLALCLPKLKVPWQY